MNHIQIPITVQEPMDGRIKEENNEINDINDIKDNSIGIIDTVLQPNDEEEKGIINEIKEDPEMNDGKLVFNDVDKNINIEKNEKNEKDGKNQDNSDNIITTDKQDKKLVVTSNDKTEREKEKEKEIEKIEKDPFGRDIQAKPIKKQSNIETKSDENGLLTGKRGLLLSVSERIYILNNNKENYFNISEIEERVLSELKKLPENIQLKIISNFCTSNMATVRSKNGLLMSMIRKNSLLYSDKDKKPIEKINKEIKEKELEKINELERIHYTPYGYAPPAPIFEKSFKNYFQPIKRQYFKINVRESDPGGYRQAFHDEYLNHNANSGHNTSATYSRNTNTSSSAAYDSNLRPVYTKKKNADYYLMTFRASKIYQTLPLVLKKRLFYLYTQEHPYLKQPIEDKLLLQFADMLQDPTVQDKPFEILDNFSQADVRNIKNINGFIIGIIGRTTRLQGYLNGSYDMLPHQGITNDPNSMYLPPLSASYNIPQNMPNNSPAIKRKYEETYRILNPLPPLPQNLSHYGAGNIPVSNMTEEAKWLSMLDPRVRMQVDDLVAKNIISSTKDFEPKCYEVLNQLSPELAVEVLKRYSISNLKTVRNKTGFFLGVVKRCRQEFNEY